MPSPNIVKASFFAITAFFANWCVNADTFIADHADDI